MSDLRAMVTNLLTALRHAGGEQAAADFEEQFNRRGWVLKLSDQLAVLTAVQRAAELAAAQPIAVEVLVEAESPPPLAPQRPPIAELTPPPARFASLAPFGPWVEVLPGKWEFLTAVHELFESSTRVQLENGLHQVFVDHLGYSPSRLDDTPRLSRQTTFTRASVIAKYEQFVIVLVESNYAGPHLSSYELIFTLHPHAIVFALERRVRVRVVTRQAAGTAHQLGSRVLHGSGKRSFPTDDPIIWARRLALLEPQPKDDARILAKRAHELIALSAEDLSHDWDSCPLDPLELPGSAWERSTGLELDLFLQPDVIASRLHLGLESELRASLPWQSRDGFKVDFAGYRLRSSHRDALAAIRTKTCTRVVVDLELVHTMATGESVDLTISLSIIVPDENGLFVVFGRALAFCPQAQAPMVWDQEDDLKQDDDEDESEDPQGEEIDEEEDDADSSGPQEYAHPNAYTGAGFGPLLRWAVGRRLRLYGWKFAKTRFRAPVTVNSFKAWIARWRDEHGDTQASSFSVLNYHLQPPVISGLRVLPIACVAPPPAWACLDLSRALPVGFAYPVAGARLGPGGVLAAPTLTKEGAIRLLCRPAEATSTNPRTRGPSRSGLHLAFIAGPLARWSELKAGVLEDALAAIASPHKGRFMRLPGPALRVLLSASMGYCAAQVHRWHMDIPAHADIREEIKLLVALGQTIEGGTALFRVPPNIWGTDPEPQPHRIMRVAEIIRDQGSKGRVYQEIHAPPSLCGRLTRIDVAKVRDADDTFLAYRVSFETTTIPPVVRAVLPDGRLAPVDVVGSEELPWHSCTSELATGIIFDPCMKAHEATGTDEELPRWREGTTGDPMETFEIVDELTFAGSRALGPDPALRVGIIDNWGQPRADDDPKLSHAYLRWLQAAHPVVAARVYDIATANAGARPSATSAAQLAAACQVARPFFAHELPEGTPATLGPYDPRRRPGAPDRWCGGRSSGGPWEWRCDCGRLQGQAYAGISCASCSSPVAREEWLEPLHESPLPVPVIHPWRRGLVAALLGLSDDELRTIMQTEDCSELVDLTAAALEAPHRSLHRRIADTNDQDLVAALLKHHAELDAALRHGLQLEDLWLTKLKVLSPRLLFDGYRLGSPDLTQSPLTKHYRSIASVAELASGRVNMLPLLRQAQWIELQRRVEKLFGSLENPEPGTLAEYWLRVWPTATDGSLPLSIPGLFSHASADDLHAMWSSVLWPKAVLEGATRLHLGIITTGEPLVLPPVPQSRIDPTEAQAWVERGAWAEFLERHLIWLAAVLLGIDGDPRVSRTVRAALPLDLADRPSVGRILLRELVRGLAPPAGRPSKLFELVMLRVPLRLPQSDRAAADSVEQRLSGLVSPDDIPALTSAQALATIFGGFFQGTPSTEHPSGWLWASTEHEAPKHFRRVVPGIAATAWRLWPDFDLMMDPLRALACGSVVQPKSPSVRAWFSLDAGELPVDLDWGERPGSASSLDDPRPAPAETMAELADEPATAASLFDAPPIQVPYGPEIVVVNVSLREWLATHQG